MNVPSPSTFRFSTTTVTAFSTGPIVKVIPFGPTAFSPSRFLSEYVAIIMLHRERQFPGALDNR